MKAWEKAKGLIHFKTFVVSFGISMIWILVSDFVVHQLIPERYNTELLQNAKGITYLFILSVILSWLHKRELRSNNRLMAVKKQSMLGEFSGMIVHEVKNPLHSLQVCTMRLKDYSKDKEVDFERYLNHMHDALIRLNDTIDFLQRLSRGGEIHHLMKGPQVDPTEHIQKIFTFLNKSFLGMNVKLNTEAIEGIRIDMNVSLMGHVFLNLTKNAIEYMRDRKIDDGEIIFSNHSDDLNIIIGISNSGPPIPCEIQSKLFNQYSSKLDQGGSGLGLIFCREVMKAHGGKIIYDETAPNPRFLLYFPTSVKTLASNKTDSPT